MIVKKYTFRAYDIRGLVQEDFDEAWAHRLGQACGTWFLRKGHMAAVIGHDCRHSSPGLHSALLRGLCSTGMDVVSLGMTPTPALYFAAQHLERRAGVMVTASHNPPEYNGFKILSGDSTIYGAALLRPIDVTGDSDAFGCLHHLAETRFGCAPLGNLGFDRLLDFRFYAFLLLVVVAHRPPRFPAFLAATTARDCTTSVSRM